MVQMWVSALCKFLMEFCVSHLVHNFFAYIVHCVSQAKIPGVCFVKIYAPWNVLCREAEFMKLKMPTKRVRIIVSLHSLSE